MIVHRKISLVFCLFMLFAFSHCGLRIEQKQETKITDYEVETARYEALSRDPRPATAAEAHLGLAWLYVDHKNPKKSYPKALEALSIYSELEPEKAKAGKVQNWIAVLQEMSAAHQEMSKEVKRSDSCKEELDRSEKDSKKFKARADQLSRDVAELRESNDQLQKKYQKQQETIEKLQETIEKLKYLDLQLEEKRRKSIK